MASRPPDFEGLLARLTTVMDRRGDACADIGLEPLPEDVRGFVETTFVLPALDEVTGIRVDLIFSTTPYEAQAIHRAIRVEIAGERVPFVTAEDLIIHKLFAGRPRDLDDAASVVRRKGPELDREYLRQWAEAFARIEGREAMPAQLAELRDA